MKSKSSTEKKKVALWSVMAAVVLTGSKLLIGILTGSLGILSEALHSALDLVAAVITYFAVRVSDKPGDERHPFGHGKVENLSALAETILLLITCLWIIYEAAHRLITGKVEIEISIWSYAVVIGSIIIDFNRSRVLKKAAKQYNSQALEADALHFSTDIWSSMVVLLGLVFANFGFYFADAISALGVAVIVIYVSYRLGKRAIDVLIDSAPQEALKQIRSILANDPDIKHYHDLKVREAGATIHVKLNIHVDPSLNIQEAHAISDRLEKKIQEKLNQAEVSVHLEPDGRE